MQHAMFIYFLFAFVVNGMHDENTVELLEYLMI